MSNHLERELAQFLSGLRSLSNIKEAAMADEKCKHCHCETEDDEEEEDDDGCEISRSLRKDYRAFFIWALNCTSSEITNTQAKKAWKKLHPSLPIPRVFEMDDNLYPAVRTVCFFLDAYPHYIESKKAKSSNQ